MVALPPGFKNVTKFTGTRLSSNIEDRRPFSVLDTLRGGRPHEGGAGVDFNLQQYGSDQFTPPTDENVIMETSRPDPTARFDREYGPAYYKMLHGDPEVGKPRPREALLQHTNENINAQGPGPLGSFKGGAYFAQGSGSVKLPPGFKKSSTSAPTEGAAMAATKGDKGDAPKGRGDWVNALMHGASMATEDELGGALAGIMAKLQGQEFGPAYQQTRDRLRTEYESYSGEHPIASLGAEIAGGIVPTVASLPFGGEGAVATGGRLLPRIASAAKRLMIPGAVYGGAYGAGNAEGGLPERALGAAEGAATGAATSLVAPAAGKVLAAPAKFIGRKVLEPVFRPATTAARKVVKAIGKDTRADPQLSQQAMESANQQGVPFRVVDTGGQRTREMLREAAGSSPDVAEESASILAERAAGRPVRSANAVQHIVDSVRRMRGVNANTTREELEAQAKAVNQPAYRRAEQSPQAQSVWTPELQRLTGSPNVQRAIAQAERIGREETAATGAMPVINPFRLMGRGVIEMQDNVTPNLQFWNAVKIGMDRQQSRLLAVGDKSGSRDVQRVKDLLLQEVDSIVPDYAAARQGASAFFRADNALEAGQKFAAQRAKNDLARRAVARMSPAEHALFGEGYATDTIQKLREGASRKALLESPGARERAEIALGQQGARQLEAHLYFEDLMKHAEKLSLLARSSDSTAKRVGKDALAAIGVGTGVGYLQGGSDITDPKQFIPVLLAIAARRGAVHINENIMRRVGQLLTSENPQELQRAIDVVAGSPSIRRAIELATQTLNRGLTPTALRHSPLRLTVTNGRMAEDEKSGEGQARAAP